jgi:hypothetical protein
MRAADHLCVDFRHAREREILHPFGTHPAIVPAGTRDSIIFDTAVIASHRSTTGRTES